MSYRHKKIKILDEEIHLDYGLKSKSIEIRRKEILNAGKINHKIHGIFNVKQTNENSKLSVKFFVIDDIQLAMWTEYRKMAHPPLLVDASKGNYTGPQEYLFFSKEALPKGTFEINDYSKNILYFLLDNEFSKLTSKNVLLTIWEEWDEQIQSLDVVTTIPPDDTSLYEDVKRFIIDAKKELKIITPHIDMFLIKDILSRSDDDVQIHIITRGRGNFSKSGKNAYDYIHEMLGKNHRTNEDIHSRLVIRDELEAIVSSADLNQDSMIGQYNAGIVLSSPENIQKLVNFFNQVWIDSKD